MFNKIIVKITLLILLGLSLAACGGGGGDSAAAGSHSTISAKVGNSFNVAAAPTILDYVQDLFLGQRAMAINSGAQVNRVVAIPTNQGHYGPADLENMQTADIAADGSFSVSLESSYDWILLLVNSNEVNPQDKIAGIVAASIDDTNTLVAFAGSKLATNLSLGTLESSGDEARSSAATLTTSSFNLTLDELKAVAKSDNSYKYLANLYLNYDPVSKAAYQAQLQYGWQAGGLSATGNSDPQAATISSYQFSGFDVTIETIISQALKDGLCGSTTSIELLPPGNISSVDNSITWTNLNGFSNDGSGPSNTDLGFNNLGVANIASWFQNGRYYCYDDDFNAQITSDFSGALIGFGSSLNIQIPAGGMPAGLWVYKVDGNELAWFDLALASPVSSPGVFDTTPIPGIRVNHTGDGQITGVAVSWFQYDSSLSQYVLLSAAQIAAINSLVRDTFIEITDDDGSDPINNPQPVQLTAIGAAESSSTGLIDGNSLVFPSGQGAWYMPGSVNDVNGKLVPTHIRVGMHMAGSLYNFSWK